MTNPIAPIEPTDAIDNQVREVYTTQGPRGLMMLCKQLLTERDPALEKSEPAPVAQPVAQVSEVDGKKCVTFYSYDALYNTPLWTKLYAAANYIDVLGGDSKSYRQAVATPPSPRTERVTQAQHDAAIEMIRDVFDEEDEPAVNQPKTYDEIYEWCLSQPHDISSSQAHAIACYFAPKESK